MTRITLAPPGFMAPLAGFFRIRPNIKLGILQS